MGIRTLLKRIEQAEKALVAQSIFSADCICFPENGPPFFCFPSDVFHQRKKLPPR
jgi:hypothetical protein